MNLSRRLGLALSLLLAPGLILNAAPARAMVYPAGSIDTSWGNGGYSNFGTTFYPADRGLIEEADGGALFPVTIYDGEDVTVGIHMMGSNGQDDGTFAAMPSSVGFTYDRATDLGYDYLRKSWMLFSETSKGLQVSRFSDVGNLDSGFGNSGSVFVLTLIKNQIHSNDPSIAIADIFPTHVDVKVSDNGSVYVLGRLEITGITTSSHKLVLWRISPDGTLDASFGNDSETGGGMLFDANQGYVPSDNARLVLDPSGTELTVVSTASHATDLTKPMEFYFKRLDVTGITATDINILDEPYFLTNLGWPGSVFSIYDAAQTSDGKIFLVGEEAWSDAVNSYQYSNLFRLNTNSGAFTSILNDQNCYNYQISIDRSDRAMINGTCYDPSLRETLARVNSNGEVDSSFVVTNSRLGEQAQFRYWAIGSFEKSNRVIVAGYKFGNCGGYSTKSQKSIETKRATNSGCSITSSQVATSEPSNYETKTTTGGYYFATAFRSNSYVVPEPPAPAPVIAPALPTQTAPVAVPASLKAKKKLKFPITSAAGNPLNVSVSGSCKVTPVYKKVKVKVGKKTKKVKQQTGWTVQMKKKKQTCTITQSDSGGNGYAALSATSIVSIK